MIGSLPTTRPNPFDPPEALAEIRAGEPVTRLGYPDGHEGWLVTGHAQARAVLADPRFSSRSELRHSPVAGPAAGGTPQAAPPGMFTSMDPPGHTRYRHLLTGQFTVRRMRQLTGRIEEIATGLLDAMEAGGTDAELVEAFARPLPALVICELLGVPDDGRDRFQERARALSGLEVSREEQIAAYLALREVMRELVAAKRAAPADDLLSGLMASDLTDDELAGIGFTLLGAGLDTTTNQLALGAFALLSSPGRARALSESESAGEVVEELLRYLSVIPFLLRVALEDVDLDGHPIKAGETVTVSIQAANRDPDRFADPDLLDLSRPSGGHLAFGHGIHQCLGQQLARVELLAGLPALFGRFPGLRLAVPPREVPLRTDMLIYGVHGLPVTWA
ncbi:cytochrome P450 [Nonomuraea sp. SBT364]|uniref:cytochrome P450 n=1 Tax=Nonomuraea sp. SBT364 TaxID=1580530 RepID=UPI00066AC911|nr:cytochrome P450 [Nonomuraea sp. SBT364]